MDNKIHVSKVPKLNDIILCWSSVGLEFVFTSLCCKFENGSNDDCQFSTKSRGGPRGGLEGQTPIVRRR